MYSSLMMNKSFVSHSQVKEDVLYLMMNKSFVSHCQVEKDVLYFDDEQVLCLPLPG